MTTTDPRSIGTKLRAAREEAGLSLRHIADSTKLSIGVLQALESDRVSRLPGGIYRRAIVRSFAREVGLDVEDTLREFLREHPDELPPLPPRPTRKPTSDDLPPAAPVPAPRPRVVRAVLGVLGALFVGRDEPSVVSR